MATAGLADADTAMPPLEIASVTAAMARCRPVRSAKRVIKKVATSAQIQGIAVTSPTSRFTFVPSNTATWVGK
jgi:hypothetical protein